MQGDTRFQFLRGLLVLICLLGALVWFLRYTIRKAKDPREIRIKWCITFACIVGLFTPVLMIGPSVGGAFLVMGGCVTVGIIMSLVWAPQIAGLIAKPITSAIDGGDQELEPAPLYSIALSKRMNGRYEEALQEVRAQLERFPEDFEGLMLSAAIYAENLNDLPRAELIIQRILNRPSTPPNHLAGALNSLADWQLRHAQDPVAARESLEQIIQRLPDTPMAAGAQQRIAHLADQKTLLEGYDRPTVNLPPGVDRIGLRERTQDLIKPEASPAETASKLLEQLSLHPQDNEARERLARVYAEGYQRPDMAIAELEELVARPHQPTKQVVQWLHQIADWQIKLQNDLEAASATLQRVIDRFPNLAAAETARSRLNLLRLELRGQEKTRAVTMGEYEQRLGLKGTPGQRRDDDGDRC